MTPRAVRGAPRAAALPSDVRGKRRQIVAAAHALFSAGFERTSMDAIAAAAGVSKVTVYAHFPSKTDLFLAVVDEKATALRKRCRTIGARTDLTLEARLTLIGASFVTLLTKRENLALFRVLIGECSRFPTLAAHIVEATRVPMLQMMSDLIGRAVAAGELQCCDCPRAAEFFFGMLHGTIRIDSLLDDRFRPTKETIAAHVALCVAAFRALYAPHGQRGVQA
ncbi:TetR/AcrR family transcriptional regulator [Chitinasiproducens palmae]|uniref:Transcriptional regulator, TetR family n=1 Tax=Chitinasiproducens palmae TaxID=1770053 RepID=A0A1H2PSP9_9BURK|nr:TetR/AcrR family transcriptional regulator [Chitinasiproducens palmae]SDV49644.1 transcriptional regulator, TetR family [Chitinasiproducens palmae]